MKKRINKQEKMLRYMAGAVLLLITVLMFMCEPVTAFGVTSAMALTIAGVTLEGKDEAIYLALKQANDSVLDKLDKDYISNTKATEQITANINLALKDLGFDKIKDMEAKVATIDDLQKKLLDQGLLITEMKSKVSEQGKKTIYGYVQETLEKNPEALKMWQEKKSPFQFELKDAVTMLNSTVTGFTYVATTQQDYPYTHPALPRSLMLNYARVRPTDSALISYADWGTIVASLSAITEGNRKTKISALLTAQQSSYHELGDYIKISERMLNDIPYMSGEITALLTDYLEQAVDDALLTTSNWGLIATVGGIAPAFTSTSMAGAVTTPTRLDDIIAAFVQIFEAKFYPTVIALAPGDWGLLLAEKTSTYQRDINGLTVLVTVTPSGMSVNGVPIVMSTKITAGYLLMGDFTKANVWIYGGVNVEMGWDGEDFTYNLRTIKAWENVHFYVKENEKPAFLYDTFANIEAAITNGS